MVPSFRVLGGVSNHYKGLHPHWKMPFTYVTLGKRPGIPAYVTLVPDFLCYLFKLAFGGVETVVVNPSLRTYQLKRDAVYVRAARLFGKKIVTFIHGWDDLKAEEIIGSPESFVSTFGKSNIIYVLYSGFREKLLAAGVKAPVLLTTTKVADSLLHGFDIKSRTGKVDTLLFLARVELNKGIMIALEAFKILKEEYPHLKLSVCGSGAAESEAKDYVERNGLSGVAFHGALSGDALVRQFRESDVYLLPTTHGEGMATSVLEAMAFGLPVITRPMGGVRDFFIDRQMGRLTESLDPADYAAMIKHMIEHPRETERMSVVNHEYAAGRFLASKVAESIERDVTKYC